MLILRNSNDAENVYGLFTKCVHSIARGGGDLEVGDDKSVSRQHATIEISVKQKEYKVILRDLGSKYGTYVNDQKLKPREPVVLKIGNRIRFGMMQHNMWVIEEAPLLVCSSTLNRTEKLHLKNILSCLGGSLVSEWSSDCSYLVMNSISLTAKAAASLASKKPIVTLEYWKKLKTVLFSNKYTPLPDYSEYIPPVVERELEATPANFQINYQRGHLFEKITFYVSSRKQYADINSMVSPAGGTVMCTKDISFSEIDCSDITKMVIVEPPARQNTDTAFYAFSKFAESKKLRLISEAEIALSILFCSIDKFCNPQFDIQSVADTSNHNQQFILRMAITQSESESENEIENTQVSSSYDSINLAFSNQKRSIESEEEECAPRNTVPKRQKVLPVTRTRSSPKKPKKDLWPLETSICESSAKSKKDSSRNKSIFEFPSDKSSTKRTSSIESFFGKKSIANTSTCLANKSFDLFEPEAGKRKSNTAPGDDISTNKKHCPESVNDSLPWPDSNCELFTSKRDRVIQSQVMCDPPEGLNPEPVEFSKEIEEMLNKTVIVTKPLVVETKVDSLRKVPTSNNGKINFKRFRKADQTTRLPHIIGGSDLVPYRDVDTSIRVN